MGKGAGARWVPKLTSLNMSSWGLIRPLPTSDIISSGHMETRGTDRITRTTENITFPQKSNSRETTSS